MRYLFLTLIFFSAFLAAATLGGESAFAVDQVKTTHSFVTASSTTVSTATSSPFSIYIGDSLSGVTNPMKSFYFTISGTYTGGGSVAFDIDSDSATAKTFTLPSVSAPTFFEIVYKDSTGKIAPVSAGTYNYTLNTAPSGVTIYGFGVKNTFTHRYAPPSCADGTTQKVKTTHSFVTASSTTVSTATSSPFSIYIGDSLSGVTNPMKSFYFTISGTYTGGGSIAFDIDSDSATAKTFTLPSVSAPTFFEIVYKDSTGKIAPVSAGNYNYTLNTTPSGVTIYGFGVKNTFTHRYAPPSCAGGYPATGEITSMVYDTGTTGAAYNSAYWKGTLNTDTKVQMKLATSDSATGPWTYIGRAGVVGTACSSAEWFDLGSPDAPVEITCESDFNNKRYFRYKVQLCSKASSNCLTGGTETPIVTDIIISWSP